MAFYATAPERCAWAESHGCLAAVLCEHHGSDDGYLPSPLCWRRRWGPARSDWP